MQVLLVGASGRVGRMVAAHWPDQAPPGLALRQQFRGDAPAGSLLWAPLDGPGPLQREVAVRGAFAAMIVLAGHTPGGGQDLAQTAPLAVACIAAARAAGVGRVLLASSAAVYDPPADGRALTEDAPLRPRTPYGAAKLEMEVAARAAAGRATELCLLRIGNVAGADALLAPRPPRLGPVVLDSFADGSGPVRSYIGPATLTRQLAALAVAPGPLPPVLNLAAPAPVAMADLARAAGLVVWRRPAPAGALARVVLDTSRLARIVPFAHSDSDPAAMVAQWRLRA